MSEQKKVVKIQLTEEQKKQIKQTVGEEVSSFEISAEQLEDRVAPIRFT